MPRRWVSRPRVWLCRVGSASRTRTKRVPEKMVVWFAVADDVDLVPVPSSTNGDDVRAGADLCAVHGPGADTDRSR